MSAPEVKSITFGVRVEEDDVSPQDILDDIADQLDEDGFDEDNWDFLAWELHGIVYVVVHGDYLIRASLLKIDYIERTESLLEVTATMKSNKSKWLYPARKQRDVPIIETATKRLDKWVREQFPQEVDEQVAINTILERSTSGENTKPISRRRGMGPAPKAQGAQKLNDLKSLISEGKSEDGEAFEVFNFADKAPSA